MTRLIAFEAWRRGRAVLAALGCLLATACAAIPVSQPPQFRALGIPTALAATSNCPAHFNDRRAPSLTSQTNFGDLWELCYTHYAILHASKTLTPVWSAEHLTRAMANGADVIERRDTFHTEPTSEIGGRAKHSDYTNSGFDRGHMTPADDMPDHSTQNETFTMSNMAPQAPLLNRGDWAALEGSLHVLAEKDGELYVVTGPVFGQTPRRLKARVSVPKAFFKAVYDPSRDVATVFYATNSDSSRCEVISLAELERRAGIDAFPALSGAVRAKVDVWQLPDGHHKPAPECTP